MCAMSMVMQHKYDEWYRRYPQHPLTQFPPTVLPTQQEVDEFRRLLEKARKYDADNNEPDCPMDHKRRQLLDLAEKLGVDISFVGAP